MVELVGDLSYDDVLEVCSLLRKRGYSAVQTDNGRIEFLRTHDPEQEGVRE